MADDQKNQQIDRVLRDGQAQMMSATLLSPPSCHLCGKQLNRYYIDLSYTEVGKYTVCIPCANSRRLEGKWIDPDAPGQQATSIQISPVIFLPSGDDIGGYG